MGSGWGEVEWVGWGEVELGDLGWLGVGWDGLGWGGLRWGEVE